MDMKHVEQSYRNFNRTLSAGQDKYMVDALAKVRENETTFNQQFLRFNGTNLYNAPPSKGGSNS